MRAENGDQIDDTAARRRRFHRALLAALLLAVVVRCVHLTLLTGVTADAPGYIKFAARLSPATLGRDLQAYYPPLYPAAIRAVHELGLDWTEAGRTISFMAGVAAVGVTGLIAGALLGPEVGAVAAVLAAVHTHLVRASTSVLAEMFYGFMVAVWGLLVLRPGGDRRFAAAAVLGAVSTTARVEGLVLAPLTLVAALWHAPRSHWVRRAVVVTAAAAAVLVPLLLVAKMHTGAWAVSGKEVAIIARKYGVESTGILGLVFGHPVAFLSRYPQQLGEQLLHIASVVLIVLAVPTVVGLLAPLDRPARHARRFILLTVGVVTLGVATINPGRRYVVPLLPLLLPWTALGLLRILELARSGRLGRPGTVLARRARTIALLGLAVLTLHAARPEYSRWAECLVDVCHWIDARHSPAPPVMARDSRIAYLCKAPYVHEPRTLSPKEIAEVVAESEARLWILKAKRRPRVLPAGVTLVTELCESRTRLLVYDVAPVGDDDPGRLAPPG